MKAMVYTHYGTPDDLEMREIDRPQIRENDVLVRVHAASLNWLDWHFLTGALFMVRLMAGLLRPKNSVLGIDVAGRVEAVGASVTRFREGDEVFGAARHGCYAEFVCVSEDLLVPKPANLTFEEAAAVPGAAIPALQGLRDLGKIQPGQRVLINGASGGLGTFAVQFANLFGAEVTGVCSTKNLDLVRSIGARHVIDYTKEDFTRGGQRYDLIFDVVAKRRFRECQHVLKPGGIYVTTQFSPWLAFKSWWISISGKQHMTPLPPKLPTQKDLVYLQKLLKDGDVTPIIERSYRLSELPCALKHLKEGHVIGKVVIMIDGDTTQ